MRVHVDHESKVGGKISADLMPGLTCIIAAHHVPMLLHEQHMWTGVMHGDPMNTMSHLCSGVRNILGPESAIDWFPRLAPVVGAIAACRGNGYKHSFLIGWIDDNRVKAHAASTGRPLRPGYVAAQTCQFLPRLPAI